MTKKVGKCDLAMDKAGVKYRNLELKTGDGHELFFRPKSVWIDPLAALRAVRLISPPYATALSRRAIITPLKISIAAPTMVIASGRWCHTIKPVNVAHRMAV